MKNLKIFFLLLILISFNVKFLYSQSENKGSMKLKIKVVDSEMSKNNNAVIKVYENDKVIKTVEQNPCVINLDLNKTYVVEVSDNKYKKYILVDSSVPMNLSDKTCPFSFKVQLSDNSSSYDKPVVKVGYGKKDFDFMVINK